MTEPTRRIAAAALALAALAAAAPDPAPAQPAAGGDDGFALPPIAFDTFTLENGLRFLVSEDRSAPVVAVNVWYDVGSGHEPPGRSGFAHLFEHLMFEETENLEDGEIDRLITQAGGSYNGTTNEYRTAYFEVLPSNRVNLALWIEAERMARLRVTPETFRNQREVVKEERRLRYDNQPYVNAQVTLDTMVMRDYPPYRHTVIGSMEDLDAATADDAREFYERFYVPNNATVVVAGDVPTAQVRELAEEYFGPIPRGADPDPLPPPPPLPRTDGERRRVVPDPLANTPLYVAGFAIPPHDHPDTYPLTLLSSVFSEGESSRLHRRLVKEEAAALVVVSALDSRLGPGIFFFGGLPNQGVAVGRIEALVDEEIEKLKAEGVTERELRKAKNQLRARLVRGRLEVREKASQLQHYRLLHGDPSQINRELEDFGRVTVDDIRRVARAYLTEANRAVVIAEPAGAGAGEEGR